MWFNMVQLFIFICSMNIIVYGTRTPQHGHAVSDEISMVAGALEGVVEGKNLPFSSAR